VVDAVTWPFCCVAVAVGGWRCDVAVLVRCGGGWRDVAALLTVVGGEQWWWCGDGHVAVTLAGDLKWVLI
jgi:hypothetical protein